MHTSDSAMRFTYPKEHNTFSRVCACLALGPAGFTLQTTVIGFGQLVVGPGLYNSTFFYVDDKGYIYMHMYIYIYCIYI